MFPIVFSSLYDNIYNGLYYALTALSLALLVFSVFVSLRKWGESSAASFKGQVLGICLAVVGFAIIIFTGVFLNALSNSGVISEVLYQRLHFVVFYASVALILFGIDASLMTGGQAFAGARRRYIKALRAVQWSVFLLTLFLALFYLLTANINSSGILPQKPVFFLPLIYVVLAGVVELPFLALTSRSAYRKSFAWFGFSMVLILVGALREATIISLGDPLEVLLLAFVPFTIASFGFYMCAKSLPKFVP